MELKSRKFLLKNVKAGKELFDYKGEVKVAVSPDKNYLVNNPQRRCPNIDKARKLLNYSPEILVEEGVKRFLTFLQNKDGE